MIVYRDQHSPADPHRLLRQLQSVATRSCISAPHHEDAVELIIQSGLLESAVADALFPVNDGIHPLAVLLRRASVESGHVLWHTWQEGRQQAGWWGSRLARTLEDASRQPLPHRVEVSVPEGYAYYAVYPEMYLEAARRFVSQTGPCDAVCLGIRSIGSSLSAVVTAALEELGCRVKSWTLRPRGHPYSRRPLLTEQLAVQLRKMPGAYFLLVDEGPGISGSSLGGTAALLHSWGIEDDHILLFPSWRTDGSHLVSAEAREQWPRHPQFTVSFEEVWIDSSRLNSAFPGDLHDISAGAWRAETYRDSTQYPAVHPQHERRKYLLKSSGTSLDSPQLLSFAGLGRSTMKKVERLASLAEAGFTVGPERVAHGFLLRPFVNGAPVSAETVDVELVEWAATYLGHLSLEHAAEPTVDDESLREMVTVNIEEGLPDRLGTTVRNILPATSWLERPVALDGRMLVHEWVRTPLGILKLDAMDHHEDHFFPGCQDIAWDVAAAIVELDLDASGRTHLVDCYRRLSGDRTITSRLPHYTIAYLSFRLGYTTLASGVLGQTDDGRRFARLAQRYNGLLGTALSAPRGG